MIDIEIWTEEDTSNDTERLHLDRIGQVTEEPFRNQAFPTLNRQQMVDSLWAAIYAMEANSK